MGLSYRPLGYALGVEVSGVDLKRPLESEVFEQIRDAWLRHLLLCFPGQHLSKEELLAFAAKFGPLEPAKDSADPDVPGIVLLTNKPVDGKVWNGYKDGPTWHSDKSYRTRPTAATLVNCKEIPEAGGDTMFANMYMAYEGLSPALREILDPLEAVHDRKFGHISDGMRILASAVAERANAAAEQRAKGTPQCVHRVVRFHPETGRKAIYLGVRARRFMGMTEEESLPLIEFINEHSVRYEFTYRHRWSVGDLLVWDNRCTLHKALCDYDLERDPRDMIRTATFGEEVGYFLPADVEPAAATSGVS